MKSHVSLLISLLGAATLLAQDPSAGSKDYPTTNAQSGSKTPSSSTGGATGTYGTRDTTASTTGTMSTSAKLGFMDKRFVTKAADGGQAEVQIAQLAADRASNPEVKSFAQKLVNDHTAVNQELTTLASNKGVTLDTDDNKDRVYNRLAKKSGTEFDREFVEHMIDDHEKDVKMFEKASTDAKDADIRSFALKHVNHLKDHLAQAQSLRQSTMPTGRDDATSGQPLKDTSTTAPSTPAPSTPSTAPSDSSKDSTKPKY
jgi:putative membrane protein